MSWQPDDPSPPAGGEEIKEMQRKRERERETGRMAQRERGNYGGEENEETDTHARGYNGPRLDPHESSIRVLSAPIAAKQRQRRPNPLLL